MENSADDRPLLGEILLKRNLITKDQLDEALEIQKKDKQFVGSILVRLGYLEERDIVVALVVQFGLPYIAVNKFDIDPDVIKLIPTALARESLLIPLDRIGEILSVVMTNPLSDEMKQKLENLTGCKVATFISTRSEIEEALAKFYGKG